MQRFIVTTTINPPTDAVRRFDALSGWTLIVVGDRRTPSDYRLRHGVYLSPDDQERLAPELSELLGWNTIQRRNLGFVLALRSGAEIVATVDDDNLPVEGWGEDLLLGKPTEMTCYDAPNGCFDPVGATEHGHLWHRGYPLQRLATRDYTSKRREVVTADVQADFWDGDPDVDAFCRMEHAPGVTFSHGRFPFAATAPAPFNSQNTFLTREALAHYCVVPCVGRVDDIWASYHLQALGYRVAFGAPSVVHMRNEHDLTRNLADEVLGYTRTDALVAAIAAGTYRPCDFWPERAVEVYDAYQRAVGV